MSLIAPRRPIAYRRRASPLHAARASIAAAYGAAIATAALLTEHPLMLAALLLGVLAAGGAAGVGGELTRAALSTALPLALLSVLVNVLVSRGGLTVFARLGDWGVLGQVNLTVEAVLYGLDFALRLLIVTLACLLVFCAADPDELLFAVRRVSPRSALTAALATRLLPVLGADARRLAEAQRSRPDGGAGGVRGRLAILRATVGGALDRSLDVAAVLELRGYGARGRGPAARRPLSRHDLAFAASGAAILALALIGALGSLAPFHTYPLISLPLSAGWIVLSLLSVLVAGVPFLDRRGIEP
ncbi:MAG TPA: energy-coupling factor transporter transmembrane component T [Solirubrobacteraceae bacterium]